MARTLNQIYDAIISSKESKSSLSELLPNPETSAQFTDDLQNGSKMDLWRLVYYIAAFNIWALEKAFDIHLIQINELIDTRLAPSLPWYQYSCFQFQYGDSLAYINHKWKYATVNTTNQIIKQCAVVEASRGLRVKVATDNGTGLEPLSVAQESAFTQYLNKIKAPGTSIVVINEAGDLLKFDIGVYVSPDQINTSGELVNDNSVRPVDDAINGYLENFTTNDFNGVFRIMALVDAIQTVAGVVDVDVRSVQYKYGALPYQEVEVNAVAFAGYYRIDPAYPLENVIEYIEA